MNDKSDPVSMRHWMGRLLTVADIKPCFEVAASMAGILISLFTLCKAADLLRLAFPRQTVAQ